MTHEEMFKLASHLQAELGSPHTSLAEALTTHYERTEQYSPEHLKVFEPRKTTAPPGYLPFRCVAGGFAAFFNEVSMQYLSGVQPSGVEITGYAVHTYVQNCSAQVYFVAEDFIRAVAATDMPDDIVLQDLNWPMPGLVLAFPTKFMLEYLGRETCYVYAAAIPAHTELTSSKLDSPLAVLVPNAKIGWQFYAMGADKRLESFTAAYHQEDSISDVFKKYGYTDFTYEKNGEVVSMDEALCTKVSSLILKLLVVLNVRPAMVETGGISRPAKYKHGKLKHSELWSPNIIGGKYKVVRSEGPGTGTHASPRWHWRRGHLTHQRIGSPKAEGFVRVVDLPRKEDGDIDWDRTDPEVKAKFWASHKRLWVEPTLVNFEEKV